MVGGVKRQHKRGHAAQRGKFRRSAFGKRSPPGAIAVHGRRARRQLRVLQHVGFVLHVRVLTFRDANRQWGDGVGVGGPLQHAVQRVVGRLAKAIRLNHLDQASRCVAAEHIGNGGVEKATCWLAACEVVHPLQVIMLEVLRGPVAREVVVDRLQHTAILVGPRVFRQDAAKIDEFRVTRKRGRDVIVPMVDETIHERGVIFENKMKLVCCCRDVLPQTVMAERRGYIAPMVFVIAVSEQILDVLRQC